MVSPLEGKGLWSINLTLLLADWCAVLSLWSSVSPSVKWELKHLLLRAVVEIQ